MICNQLNNNVLQVMYAFGFESSTSKPIDFQQAVKLFRKGLN